MRKILQLLIFFLLVCMAVPALAQYSVEQYLNIKYARDGKFSQDEKSVFYRSNESGTYQLWKIPVEGGQPQQITDFKDTVRWFECHPTRNLILFLKDKGGDENYQLFLTDLDGKNTEKLIDLPDRRVNSPWFSNDGTKIAFTANFRHKSYFDIYVYDLSTRTYECVREVDGYNLIEGWSPKDDLLIISTWLNNYNNNLYTLRLKNFTHHKLTPHEGYATYEQVAWPKKRKSKKGFYMVSDQTRNFKKLVFYQLKKGEIKIIDSAPWDTHNLCMSENDRVLGYTINAKGYSQVILIDTKKQKYWGKPKIPKGVVKSMAISKDGNLVLFTFSNATHNTDLWLYNAKKDETKRLTYSSTGGIDPASFVEPHLVEYQGGGLDIPAYIYFPKNAKQDGTLPCLVYIHGGPESQERPDFAWSFQYFVNKGFVIFAPNVRGSSGFGKQYMQLDNKQKRLDSVLDAIFGVKWLNESKYVDPKKVGVYGGSYGGFMVLSMMTMEPKMFAAGVDIVGISNFVTFLERTHSSRRKIREAEYGTLFHDRQFLEQISPIHRIDKIKGALMVIHGANDPRVPKHEADQIVQKAKEADIKVEYLLYEDEGHGISKLKNKMDAYSKMAVFFEKYLLPIKEESTDDKDEVAAQGKSEK